MMNGAKINVSDEITFRTARSGGKGGQNVNKVETMVEGYFDIRNSRYLTEGQKVLVFQKLEKRINAEGLLLVKSSEKRTQLENKERVKEKINGLIQEAIHIKKVRIATRPGKAVKEKRLEDKRRNQLQKQSRGKIRIE